MSITQGTSRTVGPYGGMLPPLPPAGISAGVGPYGYATDGAAITLTTNVIYYIPYPIFRTTTFAGAQVYTTGATTGKHARLGLYAEAATGGPGALLKDFGAVTCGASGAVLQAASSVTIPGPQMCYAVILTDAAALSTIGFYALKTNVGFLAASQFMSMLPDIGGANISAANIDNAVIGWKAAQTYGALPATAPAPSSNVLGTESASTGALPGIQFYA